MTLKDEVLIRSGLDWRCEKCGKKFTKVRSAKIHEKKNHLLSAQEFVVRMDESRKNSSIQWLRKHHLETSRTCVIFNGGRGSLREFSRNHGNCKFYFFASEIYEELDKEQKSRYPIL